LYKCSAVLVRGIQLRAIIYCRPPG